MVREIADKVKKVEISIIGEGWEWLGKLDQESIDELCAFADKLSDRTYLLTQDKEKL